MGFIMYLIILLGIHVLNLYCIILGLHSYNILQLVYAGEKVYGVMPHFPTLVGEYFNNCFIVLYLIPQILSTENYFFLPGSCN